MISVNDAFKLILETKIKLDTEVIHISQCRDRVLAEDIFSYKDQPPFDRVAMDGIAINLDKVIQKQYTITGLQAAGTEQLQLKDKGHCIEVMTGAILPRGCNCVIPYEKIKVEEGKAFINENNFKEFQNVHKKGVDYKEGVKILNKEVKITSSIMAILASQGKSKVRVYKIPQIVIISTGSELIDMDRPTLPHQIYMSNSYALENELHSQGFTNTQRIHIVDDQQRTITKIKECLEKADVLILTGGVSKGKFDFIPGALKEIGAKEVFHKIKQKPGKPLWYGIFENKQIFALPGNPVSCLMTLRRYVIESLKDSIHMSRSKQTATLSKDVTFNKPFTLFKAVTTHFDKDGKLIATPIQSNGSGDFYSIGHSSGFLELDEDKTLYKKDTSYTYYPWGN